MFTFKFTDGADVADVADVANVAAALIFMFVAAEAIVGIC